MNAETSSRDPLGTVFALKAGVVPRQGLAGITVGRKEQILSLKNNLDAISSSARARSDFIVGEYGEGKSHLLELLRQSALARNIAVSSLSANFDTCQMHRPKLVLHALTASLELPNQHVRGLLPLLRNLSHTQGFLEQTDALYDDWVDPPNDAIAPPELSLWPAALYSAAREPETAILMSRWMSGEGVLAGIVREALRESMIPPSRLAITIAEVPKVIIGLAHCLSRLGYGGLVVLIDELENALSPAATLLRRRQCATLLRTLLVDRCPLYIVGAVTPSVRLTIRSDLREHKNARWIDLEAVQVFGFLASRLGDDRVVQAEHLTPSHLAVLGKSIVQLHRESFHWPASAFTPAVISKCVGRAHHEHMSARGFAKLLVELLELSHQHGFNPLKSLEQG